MFVTMSGILLGIFWPNNIASHDVSVLLRKGPHMVLRAVMVDLHGACADARAWPKARDEDELFAIFSMDRRVSPTGACGQRCRQGCEALRQQLELVGMEPVVCQMMGRCKRVLRFM